MDIADKKKSQILICNQVYMLDEIKRSNEDAKLDPYFHYTQATFSHTELEVEVLFHFLSFLLG